MPNPLNVFDTSALLAWILREPGASFVEAQFCEKCAISAVNLTELATKLIDLRIVESSDVVKQRLERLDIMIVSYDDEQAIEAASLRESSRKLGLSLGDRACIALAKKLNARVLTTDKAWLKLDVNIAIIDVRNPNL